MSTYSITLFSASKKQWLPSIKVIADNSKEAKEVAMELKGIDVNTPCLAQCSIIKK